MLRINLGSGQRPFAKPWINVDCQDRWSPDVVADGAHMPMFEDGSADLIVLHHVAEHFGCSETNDMLKECQRILASQGSLLVFMPNMRELAKGWLRGQIDDQIYFTNVYGAYMGDEADRHKWGFTRESLADLLLSVGFRAAGPFDWRKIEGADIAQDWWILGMEAVK